MHIVIRWSDNKVTFLLILCKRRSIMITLSNSDKSIIKFYGFKVDLKILVWTWKCKNGFTQE